MAVAVTIEGPVALEAYMLPGRVTDAGGLYVDIAGFYYEISGTHDYYAGAVHQLLTDATTNYIYFNSTFSLVINTTGFPVSGAYVKLAIVVTAGGAIQTLTDCRALLTSAGTGLGESNTASNVGTAGVGVFKQKSGVDLQFKKINAGSNKISITDDTTDSEVDVDVVQANLSISASQAGLGNVTNDAQLKRADNDWSGFTELTATPEKADLILMELASGPGTKRKCTSVVAARHPYLDSSLYFYEDFLGKTINVTHIWGIYTSGTGSLVDIYTGLGGQCEMRAGPAANRYSEMHWDSRRSLSFPRNTSVTFFAKINDITSCLVDLGVSCSTGYAKFEFDSSWDATYLTTMSRKTSNSRKVSTIAVDTNWHTYKLESDDLGTSIKFYYDGVLIATHDTVDTVPDAAGEPYLQCRTYTAATRSLYLDFIKVSQNRA